MNFPSHSPVAVLDRQNINWKFLLPFANSLQSASRSEPVPSLQLQSASLLGAPFHHTKSISSHLASITSIWLNDFSYGLDTIDNEILRRNQIDRRLSSCLVLESWLTVMLKSRLSLRLENFPLLFLRLFGNLQLNQLDPIKSPFLPRHFSKSAAWFHSQTKVFNIWMDLFWRHQSSSSVRFPATCLAGCFQKTAWLLIGTVSFRFRHWQLLQ